MLDRVLVAFEAPCGMTAETDEVKWDRWVSDLRSRSLQLASDLDPVAVVGDIQVYEAVALSD